MEMEIVFPGGARVDAVMGNTVIPTDQDGAAPAPFAPFLASIGTCAGIYVLGFCQHRVSTSPPGPDAWGPSWATSPG